MRLCGHWIPSRRGEPPGPCAAGPLRLTDNPDPLRCARCAGWTPHGALPSIERVAILAREVASLTSRLAEDYAWAHGISFAPGGRNGSDGRRSNHSDSTGGVIADPARAMVRAYAAIAARLLEAAVRLLRSADEAVGDALLAAEPPGPKDHTKAPFHDTGGLRYPEPGVYAAQDRRRARGEGVPS